MPLAAPAARQAFYAVVAYYVAAVADACHACSSAGSLSQMFITLFAAAVLSFLRHATMLPAAFSMLRLRCFFFFSADVFSARLTPFRRYYVFSLGIRYPMPGVIIRMHRAAAVMQQKCARVPHSYHC